MTISDPQPPSVPGDRTDCPEGVLRIDVLGPLTVRRDGERVDVGPAMVRTLLAVLAVQPNQVVPREQIVEALWGEPSPATARSLLHNYVSRLRARLRPEGARGPGEIIVRERAGYRVVLAADATDLARFDQLHGQARQARDDGRTEPALERYREALATWNGEILSDLEPRVRELPAIAAARRRRTDAVIEYGQLCCRAGRAAEALEEVRREVALAPLHEGLHLTLMLALAAVGERASALDVYGRFRSQLAEELGVDPGQELQQAHVALLRDGQERGSHQPRRAAESEGTTRVGAAGGMAAPNGVPPAGRPSGGAIPSRLRRRVRALWPAGFLVLAVVIVLILAAVAVYLTRPPPASPASPSEFEDFTGSTLNRSTGWFAYERTFENGSSWSPSMVRVRDGELQISGVGSDPTGQGAMSGGVCWCADHHVQRYGTWEIRAKFDAGSGYAPEIGLWPESGEERTDGSFVIRVDDPQRSMLFGLLHGPGGANANGTPVPGQYSNWSTYRIEWRPTSFVVTVDDRPITDSRNADVRVPVPSAPMYLYLQQRPGPSGSTPGPNKDTPDRVVMHVDSVRYTPYPG